MTKPKRNSLESYPHSKRNPAYPVLKDTMPTKTPSKPIQTILLVDDHEMVLRSLHNYLEKRGYNVLEACNGEEALLLAEACPALIQVLVTDLVMAKMNGSELARQLMALRPEMQVIMMSGFPDEMTVQRELTPDIPILAKPFPPKKLWDAIVDVLANPQSERTVTNLAGSDRWHISKAVGSTESRCE